MRIFEAKTAVFMKLLILCTGNSCRSQMAEAFIKSFNGDLEVFSAGTDPADEVHPKAIQVMKELGIDMTDHRPRKVEDFLKESFDYVITVCGHAREHCPVFSGEVKKKVHIGFEDPAEATGTEEQILLEFRRIRDQIRDRMQSFIESL